VVTESRRAKGHVATRWHLASRHRAPWKWLAPPGHVEARGTAVELRLHNALSPLLDPGFVEGVLRRHFQPLLDPSFEPLLSDHYRRGVRMEVNGREVALTRPNGADGAPIAVRLAGKRKPSGVGWMVRGALPLPEEDRGLAISTLGKVIRRGWDWLGVSPARPDCVGGLIEVPGLSACLTLNKGDFVRSGARGATYLAYRKVIQEAVARQLAAWGDAGEAESDAQRRAARPVERDLERVLVDMSDDYPLLASLVDRRLGGQRRLPIGKPGPSEVRDLVVAAVVAERGDSAAPPEMREEAAAGPEAVVATQPAPEVHVPGQGAAPKPARYGLTIQFESRPQGADLGRLVESTVWVNDAHPAYRRAVASRSEGYHIALSVALALAALAVEPSAEHGFVTAFLARWGEALEKPARPEGRSRRRAGA
jgi:hypothetical protein